MTKWTVNSNVCEERGGYGHIEFRFWNVICRCLVSGWMALQARLEIRKIGVRNHLFLCVSLSGSQKYQYGNILTLVYGTYNINHCKVKITNE